jgi:hypothetical protein
MAGLYDGVIPPLLGYAGMQRLTDLSYADAGMYMGEAHNNLGFYSWEEQALSKYDVKGMRFLVLAAGGGREAVALLRRGASVDAWECNQSLREFGNGFFEMQGLPCHIRPMEPNRFPPMEPGKMYDFGLVGWSAYCHILKEADRVQLLKEMAKVVDGPVLISFVSRRPMRKFVRVLRKIVSSLPGATGDISDNLQARPGTINVGFDKEDIYQEAAAAGFRVIEYKNRFPEYPYAILSPGKSPVTDDPGIANSSKPQQK